MITLFTGDNSYEIEQDLAQLTAKFDGTTERYDGVELELSNLPDLLMGVSLFSEQRVVVVRGLSANKTVWEALPSWLDRLSDDIHLVLIEPQLDRRTKAAKTLIKSATLRHHASWSERDTPQAEKWVMKEAKVRDIRLNATLAQLLVSRVGVHQWQLHHALEKLRSLDIVTEDSIRELIEAQPVENVFELFETALRGDVTGLQRMLETLRGSEDPYMLFGLLAGQAFQLAALTVAQGHDDVAGDLGIKPYSLRRLRPYVQGQKKANTIVNAFADADEQMKTASLDPWLAIERSLLVTATRT